MKEILEKADELLRENRSSVLATIIRQAGPSPRGVGTKCLIMDDGSLAGTVGGGILEARTMEKAKEVLKTGLPARLHFSLKGTDVAETDMLCGGTVELFLEPVFPGDPSQAAVFREAVRAMDRGEGGLLVTLLNKDWWGRGKTPRLFMGRTGEKIGTLPGAGSLEDRIEEGMKRIFRARQISLFTMKNDRGEEVEILAEPLTAQSFLYVFGAGHVSRQIVPLAELVDFQVTVIDDREEFADPALFPEAHAVRHIPLDGAVGRLHIGRGGFVVIVTRGHMHDKTVLAQALKTEARYIGMIGSRRKRDIIYEKLLEEGFSKDDIGRVHSPIGLDIGAETPEEIAVSIVAELIKVRAGD